MAVTTLLEPGALLDGKYRIVRVLGQGGMGTVLLAHHEQLDQNVAIKVLVDSLAHDADVVTRFSREARAAAKLQSEHVARVTDVGRLPGIGPYMVMEYLRGQDLSALVQERGPLQASEAVDYVLEAIDALAEAHSLGIIHRDLKPANLFLATRADGSRIVKVLDFGISKTNALGDHNMKLTNTSAVMGSPAYMSPEQLRSARDVDVGADIWSLGVVLYELLSGVVPFDGETVGAIFTEIVSKDPKPLRARGAAVPEFLEAIVFRCLRREVRERFANVAELAHALAPFGTGRAQKEIARATSLLGMSTSSPAFDKTLPAHATSLASSATSLASIPPSPISAKSMTLGPAPGARTLGTWDTSPKAATRRSSEWVILGVVLAAVAIGVVALKARAHPSAQQPLEPVPNAQPQSVPTVALPSVLSGQPAPFAAIPSTALPAVPTRIVDAGALPSRTKPAGPRAVRPGSSPDCNPPYYLDSDGNRVFKKECI